MLNLNELTTLPDQLGNLGNLVQLTLWGNQLLSIPPSLGNLGSLSSLSLYDNQLTSIPPELGNLGSLRFLRLDNNLLGSIPSQLGNLANLWSLWLYDNQLSSIPPELGNLGNLVQLELKHNQLSTLPAQLGNLGNLTVLDLSYNQLSCAIPPELGNLGNLLEFNSTHNSLCGNIPPALGNLSNLTKLDLSYNQLSGPIPPELGNLVSLWSLDLQRNQLSAGIPSQLGNLANLRELWLDSNQLSGSIPPELGNLDNLERLWLHNNQLSGSIPPKLGDLGGLAYLWLHSNQLSGNIPAALGNLGVLRSLDLSENRLAGKIPGSLQSLQYLLGVDLQYNALYSDDPALVAFLDSRQGDEWQRTQTVAPARVIVRSVGDRTVWLAWPPITYTEHGGGYVVLSSALPGGTMVSGGWTAGKTTATFPVTGLQPGQSYDLSVLTFTDPHANNKSTVVSEPGEPIMATTSNLGCATPQVDVSAGGSPTELSVVSIHDGFEWSTGETSRSISVQPSSSTWYWVRTTGPGSCDETAVVLVSGSERPTWIPVASHANGAEGSAWRTDLGLLNTGTRPTDATLDLYTSGGPLTLTRTVPAGAQVVLADVVGQMGYSGSGALQVTAAGELAITSRTYSQVGSAAECFPGGTSGQSLGQAEDGGIDAGQWVLIPQLQESSAYRSNVAVVNTGRSPASVRVHLYDGDGAELASYDVSLTPGEWKQENRPFARYAGRRDLAAGYARVEVLSGAAVVAYGSVLDSTTNDPTTMAMVRPQAATVAAWIPVVSHSEGVEGSFWRSDLGLLNGGTVAAEATLTLYSPGIRLTLTRTVPAGAQIVLTDVVGQIGSSGSGALQVTATAALIVTSRTYSLVGTDSECLPGGTWGQSLAAEPEGGGIRAGQSGLIPQLQENTPYRSNLAVVNTGRSPALVKVRLFDGAGAELASYDASLAPGEWRQENRPFARYAGRRDLAAGFARVEVLSGAGIVAYGSVLDNITNDPTTMPMLR